MGGPDSSAIGVLPSTRGSLSYAMNSRLRLRSMLSGGYATLAIGRLGGRIVLKPPAFANRLNF